MCYQVVIALDGAKKKLMLEKQAVEAQMEQLKMDHKQELNLVSELNEKIQELRESLRLANQDVSISKEVENAGKAQMQNDFAALEMEQDALLQSVQTKTNELVAAQDEIQQLTSLYQCLESTALQNENAAQDQLEAMRAVLLRKSSQLQVLEKNQSE